MSEERLDKLASTLKVQSSAIRALEEKVGACNEQLDAVCECLRTSGIIGPDSLGICLHRRKFAAARKSFGLSADARLDDLFNLGVVTVAVGLFAGSSTVRAIGRASKSIHAAAHTAWPTIVERATISLYVCGGRDDDQCSDFVERFSPKESKWEVLPPMREQRCGAMAGAVNGKIYVCGGFNGVTTLDSVECFHQDRSIWEPGPPMLSQRAGGSAAVLAGNLYICGGYDEENTLRSVHCLESPWISQGNTPTAAHGVWSSCPSLNMEREWPAFSALEGKLYACGGKDGGDPGRPLRSVECTDPAEWLQNGGARWQFVAGLLEPRAVASGATIGAWLYVCGGWTTDHQDLSTVERFHPGSNAWEVTAPMLVRRYGAAAVVAGSHLYIFGGSNDEDGEVDSVEYFEAVEEHGAGWWRALPPMSEKRSVLAAAALLRW